MVTNALEMRNGNQHYLQCIMMNENERYLHLKYLDMRQDEARSPIPQKHHQYQYRQSTTNTANGRGTIRAVELCELQVKGDKKRKRRKPEASATTAPHV
jgi:hypothetical protein